MMSVLAEPDVLKFLVRKMVGRPDVLLALGRVEGRAFAVATPCPCPAGRHDHASGSLSQAPRIQRGGNSTRSRLRCPELVWECVDRARGRRDRPSRRVDIRRSPRSATARYCTPTST